MEVNLKQYIKKLALPEGFVAPSKLEFGDLIARPLTRQDLAADLAGVNTSIGTIQNTRGGSWPTEPLTEEFDFLDLAWHEREFRDSSSFAYVVYNTSDEYVGCFYLYPMDVRTELSSDMDRYDVDASWWVTAAMYEKGYYQKVYSALREWLQAFRFRDVYYSNKSIPKL